MKQYILNDNRRLSENNLFPYICDAKLTKRWLIGDLQSLKISRTIPQALDMCDALHGIVQCAYLVVKILRNQSQLTSLILLCIISRWVAISSCFLCCSDIWSLSKADDASSTFQSDMSVEYAWSNCSSSTTLLAEDRDVTPTADRDGC